MSARQGAALQSYNNELVKCLEDLCERRAKIKLEIAQEERDKSVLETKIRSLQDQLDQVQTSLDHKMKTLSQYDQTIQQTQDDYMKIVESSQILLSVVRKETQELQRPQQTSFKHKNDH